MSLAEPFDSQLIANRACVSSILRLYYSVQLLSIADVTYNITYLFWTATLEGTSAILVASFPVMPRLYQYIRNDRHLFLSKFGFGSSGRRLLASSPRTGKKGSSGIQTDDKQLRPQWLQLEEVRTGSADSLNGQASAQYCNKGT